MSFSRSAFFFILLAGGVPLFCAAQDTTLSLDEAIQLALENNQNVKVSAYTPQIGRAGVLAAYGSFDPALTYTRSEGETEEPGSFVAPQTRPLTR